ncbi:DUF2637 domain-containing protein [Streptomyces kronopolitis]|uniref:DUF2637 domain-containing protein n=1 Tax=Streptomyces kronopolitis TaxID=1612435 RepID=UPI003D9693A7
MDEETPSTTEQEAPTSPRRENRWEALRALRRSANENRSPAEWVDWGMSALTTAGTYALIGLGFSASYETIRQIAEKKGKFSPNMSHIVPLSFEGGIIILSLHVIREARKGRRAGFLRLLVALGALATLVTNARAEAAGFEGTLTHVVPVGMFIVCFEYLIHSVRKKALEDMGLLPPPLASLRGVEWLLNTREAFARWRLMALHGIHSPEQALWVREHLLISKHELKAAHNGSWRGVPTHVRLRARTKILAEGEQRFRVDSDQNPGRYTLLVEELSRPAALENPAPATEHRELQNADEQTALPVGQQAISEPHGDVPYAADSADPRIGEGEPRIETREERESREDREEEARERQAQASSDANYRRTVQLVIAALEANETVNGPRIAERHSVGARTVQRHLQQMEREGLLPEDILTKR